MSVYNDPDQGWYGGHVGLGHKQGEMEGAFGGWLDSPLPDSVFEGTGVVETPAAADGERDTFDVGMGELAGNTILERATAADHRFFDPRRD